MAAKKVVRKPKQVKDVFYSGFDDNGKPPHDPRCEVSRWGTRMALLAELDSVACRSVGEHMTVRMWQNACMNAWNKAQAAIDNMTDTIPGDPPVKPTMMS